MSNPKGFSSLIVIVLILVAVVVIGGGVFWVVTQQIGTNHNTNTNTANVNTTVNQNLNASANQDANENTNAASNQNMNSVANQNANTPINQNANTSSNTNSDPTADWKTYRNEKYGFEVKYPEEWKLKEEEFDGSTQTRNLFLLDLRTADEQKVVTIGVHANSPNLSLEEWMSQTGYKQVVFEFAQGFDAVNIDGQVGRKYTQVPLLNSKTDNYLVPFNGRVYIFRSVSNAPEFDSIVNSFRFIQ